MIYAGGEFTRMGGQARNYLAALDTATGSAIDWDPSPNGYVYSLAVSGSTVYAGGLFSTIRSGIFPPFVTSRYSIAAIDAATGWATSWKS